MTEVIYNEDFVFRRVPTHLPSYIKPDGSISSRAYQKRRDEDGISVALERLSSFQEATLGDRRFRLLKLGVGIIRNVINDGLDVIHDPQIDNNAHCLIVGKITESKSKQLLNNSLEVTS